MIRTPDQRLRVFVSSTLGELAPEREVVRAAIEQLRLVPVMFELGARPHPPQDLYRAYLEQSQIFVGIYWERYGWVAPDMEISGLEDEWLLSAHHPRLVYIKESTQREPRLDALIDRIREGGVSYRSFADCSDLRELVETDLAVLLSERFDASDTEALEPAPTVAPRPSVLPATPAALIGRDDDIARLRTLFADDCRLVTVTGVGGSGKTRLAIEFARVEAAHLGWDVAFVDLSSLRSSDYVLPAVAAGLGVKDVAPEEIVNAIASVTAHRQLLLVVDNFEHVVASAGVVAEILQVTENLRVLATSRQALHLRWEQEYPLAPLDVPNPDVQHSVVAISASPAIELLVRRIRRVRPDFVLDDANAPILAEIARRLDGLPLALELAAARLRVLQPADLLSRLEQSLDMLTEPTADRPGRHHTLRATISWSHDHLTPSEQIVFRRLGIFAGGASLPAVEAVCSGDGVERSAVLDIVSSLVDKSLVTLTDGSAGAVVSGDSRFTLLATIREFALEQLVAAGEAEVAFDRHLDWYADLATRAWDGFWSIHMEQWLTTVEAEEANLRLALDHAAGAGRFEIGLGAAASLWPFWDVRGQYREGEARLRTLLARGGHDPSLERGRGLCARGWLLALMGDFQTGHELMLEGLPSVRRFGTRTQVAWALAALGNVAFSRGLVDDCTAAFSEELELAREEGDTFLIGMGRFGLAYAAFLRGDLVTMREHLESSLAITRVVYQPWGVAWAQFSLGVLAIIEGDLAASVAPLTESLRLRWSIRDVRGLSEAVELLAYVAGALDDSDWSVLLHGSAELQREANGLSILPFLVPLHDENVERLRTSLGADAFERCWQLGRNLPLDKLVAQAMARSAPAEP